MVTPLAMDDNEVFGRYIESHPAGVPKSFGTATTPFQRHLEELLPLGLPPWTPFTDMEEWEFVVWLLKRVNKTGIEEFLKLPIVSPHSKLMSSSDNLFRQSSEWESHSRANISYIRKSTDFQPVHSGISSQSPYEGI
jgi:hypothetical protein